MNKIAFLAIASLAIAACGTNGNGATTVKALQDSTIKIHDEIMPQIAHFDRDAVKIDSILANLKTIKTARTDLDTIATRKELSVLKANLESATDHMMDWMKGYNPDSTDVKYFETELQKVSDMKKIFDNVSKESEGKLKNF
ncbi:MULTISPECIES: transposase [unclassified Sphingobacterium]|jgi:5-bromo-4-chloroindolyl phosphate hydrolysis protein|uniref:transposase n=1 Tax=unclassified Sphingobacterium TaxID=2609468 RepID=UPI0025DAF3FE|nr:MULTISPECIES: transposase [unclassified Sphingobacterium]MDR0263591.1 transposase [Sphingobacterium sp.]